MPETMPTKMKHTWQQRFQRHETFQAAPRDIGYAKYPKQHPDQNAATYSTIPLATSS